MSRSGFNHKIHPYLLQLRMCRGLDLEGIQNRSSVSINLREGKITNYNTNDAQVSTNIREYTVNDDELRELYSFFTLDAIQKFENMSESENRQYMRGYYDWAILRYLLICEGGRISDGVRHTIYSNDPIEMVLKWMHKTLPFNLDL